MIVNTYFGPIWTTLPQKTPNYGPVNYKYEVNYYRKTYCFPENLARFQNKTGKISQERMYSSKYFNYNYMEFFSY